MPKTSQTTSDPKKSEKSDRYNKDCYSIQQEIVIAALEHVVFDGWTLTALHKGAEDKGYTIDTVRSVFDNDIYESLGIFSALADQWMLEKLNQLDVDEIKVRARIKTAIFARLDVLEPYQEAVRHSLTLWAKPFRQAKGGKIVWNSADAIWDWAGDSAHDYNFYTKRILLSGILASTIPVWLNDEDENLKKTHQFVDRRIQNVLNFGKLLSRFTKKP